MRTAIVTDSNSGIFEEEVRTDFGTEVTRYILGRQEALWNRKSIQNGLRWCGKCLRGKKYAMIH